jgi:hypothetical protein
VSRQLHAPTTDRRRYFNGTLATLSQALNAWTVHSLQSVTPNTDTTHSPLGVSLCT